MRVVAIRGPFGSRALVDMPTDRAIELLGEPITLLASPLEIVEATERDIADMETRLEGVDGSALAALAMTMAFELVNPYNSATSKAMCARALREALAELRAQVPAETEADRIDELAGRVADKRGAAKS